MSRRKRTKVTDAIRRLIFEEASGYIDKGLLVFGQAVEGKDVDARTDHLLRSPIGIRVMEDVLPRRPRQELVPKQV